MYYLESDLSWIENVVIQSILQTYMLSLSLSSRVKATTVHTTYIDIAFFDFSLISTWFTKYKFFSSLLLVKSYPYIDRSVSPFLLYRRRNRWNN